MPQGPKQNPQPIPDSGPKSENIELQSLPVANFQDFLATSDFQNSTLPRSKSKNGPIKSSALVHRTQPPCPKNCRKMSTIGKPCSKHAHCNYPYPQDSTVRQVRLGTTSLNPAKSIRQLTLPSIRNNRKLDFNLPQVKDPLSEQ